MRCCQFCGVVLRQQRGRPRVACNSRQCQNERQKRHKRQRTQQAHAQGLTRSGKPDKRRLRKLTITQRQLTTLANKQWVRDEMHRRGRCAYHQKYFGCNLLVNDAYIEVFEFDHVNRAEKRGREYMVSRLIGRAPLHVVQQEVELCELVCSNCHQIKTRRNRDFTAIHKSATQHPQLTFE